MKTLTSLALIAAALVAAPLGAHAAEGKRKPMTQQAKKTGHLEVGDIRYAYEIRGSGEPLLLLHGGLGSFDMFGPNLDILSEHRQLVLVDLQGHGRTTLGSRLIDYRPMADDLAVIVEKLGIAQLDVAGYSMGAGVALRFAIQHPAKVRRLVLASGGYAQDGFYPEMLPMQAQVGAAMAEHMKETPMYQSYMAVAPRKEDFPRLLDSMGAWMRTPYDWSEEVKTLKMPVMLVWGDSDMFRPEHMVKFYQLLGGGLKDAGWQREHMSRNRLAILPDVTHYELFASPAFGRTILPFLDGRSGAASWAEQVKEQSR